MEFVSLRRAGGSLVLTIPKVFVRSLGLAEGERVGISEIDGKLVAEPHVNTSRPRYRLKDLLAECDTDAPLSPEDRTWLAGRPQGNEAL